MIPVKLIATSSVIAILTACAIGADRVSVSDSDIGLSKTSVFNTPDPEVFVYDETRARYSKPMERAFPGAPPQVPHEMVSMLPITLDDNQCLECHDRPDEIGADEVKGGQPMDKMHYSEVGAEGSEEGWRLSGLRFTCNQCHVPQAGVAPLVDNSFAN
jgi:cytochrome c-type protein NapB